MVPSLQDGPQWPCILVGTQILPTWHHSRSLWPTDCRGWDGVPLLRSDDNDTVGSILCVCAFKLWWCAFCLSLPQITCMHWEKPAAMLCGPGKRSTWWGAETSRQQPCEWSCQWVLLHSKPLKAAATTLHPRQTPTPEHTDKLLPGAWPSKTCEIINAGCFQLLSPGVCDHR